MSDKEVPRYQELEKHKVASSWAHFFLNDLHLKLKKAVDSTPVHMEAESLENEGEKHLKNVLK